jgi:hypothetical protein
MADLDVIVYQHLDGTLGIGYGPHTVGCYTAAIREDHQSGGLLQGGRMKDFRQLKVWQRALHLTLAIYHLTASFPRDEIYGLTSQDAAGRHIDPREFS